MFYLVEKRLASASGLTSIAVMASHESDDSSISFDASLSQHFIPPLMASHGDGHHNGEFDEEDVRIPLEEEGRAKRSKNFR